MSVKKGRNIIEERDIGGNFFVYNGKNFISVAVIGSMVGRKFGEFILTRVNKAKINNKKLKKK